MSTSTFDNKHVSVNSPLSIDSDIDQILTELYHQVTKGSAALLRFITNLFKATRSQFTQECNTNTGVSSISQWDNPRENKPLVKLTNSTLTITLSQNSVSRYSLVITFRSKEHANEAYLHINKDPKLDTLVTHIKQATSMCAQLEQQQTDLRSITYVLEHYPLPFSVFDDKLNSIFNNAAFKSFYQSLESKFTHQLLAREHLNITQLCDQDFQRSEFNAALRKLANSTHQAIQYLKLNIGGYSYTVILFTQGEVPNLFRHYARNNIVWVYLLDKDYSSSLMQHEKFTKLGLSRAEQTLCTLLFQGLSLNEIALNRGVSIQTVRKQLQSVLRKTDNESQESLIKYMFETCMCFELLD